MVLKPLPRIILAMSVVVCSCPLGLAQLPATNMGKFVHQPGDNQYDSKAQAERHAQPVVRAVVPSQSGGGGGGGGGAYRPVPKPIRPDYSIMPITCDEPIKPPGFPPLPDSLDLPNLSMRPMGSYGVGAGGSASGASTGTAGGGGGAVQPVGVHQHYSHYDAGAFIPQQEKKGSGYKCLPAGPVGGSATKSDYYNANTNGQSAPDPSQPQYNSAAEQQLKSMGKAPKLKADGFAQQAAPEAVTVNQATTQDLSLPEDEQASGQQVNKKGKTSKFAQRAGQMITRPVYQMMNSTSGMTGSMGSMMRFK